MKHIFKSKLFTIDLDEIAGFDKLINIVLMKGGGTATLASTGVDINELENAWCLHLADKKPSEGISFSANVNDSESLLDLVNYAERKTLEKAIHTIQDKLKSDEKYKRAWEANLESCNVSEGSVHQFLDLFISSPNFPY